MSTSYDVMLVYGFPLPGGYNYDKSKMDGLDLWKWLEQERLHPCEQINAGMSNGGYPDFLIGVVVAQVRDCTRGKAYTKVGGVAEGRLALSVSTKDPKGKVTKAAELLGIDPETIGFYIVGDAA
jgi:hypothetical protein